MPVPLHNHYVEAFESRFGLTETERDFMKSAGIRSPRQLRMLLAHTPNMRDLPQAKSGLFRYVHLLHCSGGELRTDSETHRGRLVAGVNLSDTDIGIVATLPLHNATGGMPLSPRATTDVKKIGLRAIANADRANVIANPKRLYLDGKPGLARRWPARDQGTQNSCTAFAVAACLEFLGADEINPILPLSAAFLYNFSKDFAK